MVTKSPGPDERMDMGALRDPALSAYYRLMRLKRLYRQGWLKRGLPEEICESVAEHSFGTALLALLAAPPPGEGAPDRARSALLALVHEMGEAYAGDITPVDGVSRADKLALERASIERTLGGHPDAAWFMGLWEEFEAGETPEARFVRELDRLEMGLQAALHEAEGFPGMPEFFESARRSVTEPRLRAMLEAAIEAGRSAGRGESGGEGWPTASSRP